MFSKPLFKQSVKANWALWLAVTVGMIAIVSVINLIMGSLDLNQGMDEEALREYAQILYQAGALQGDPSKYSIPDLITAMGLDYEKMQNLASMDINFFIKDMHYTMTSVLLGMIFVIVTGNKLVAAQVDRGSMAYVLSTPTKRSSVVMTQAVFMLLSLFGMFVFTMLFDFLTSWIGYGTVDFGQIALMSLGGFLSMLAISGICFMSSCLFSLSKNALAVGGSISVFFLICKILGMFGSPAFVNMGMGVEAMNIFNYMTIITLFDTASIQALSTAFIWKFVILFGIAAATYAVGMVRFTKKDLPL